MSKTPRGGDEAEKFSIPEISGTLEGSLRNFSALGDKKVLTENRDTTPPSLIHIFLRYQKFSQTEETEGTPYEVFRSCETKKIRHKIVISPSHATNFFDNRNFLIH